MTPTSDNAYCHADVEVLLYAYRRLLPPASVQKKPVTVSECFSDSQGNCSSSTVPGFSFEAYCPMGGRVVNARLD